MVSLLKNAVLHRNSSLDSLRVVKSQGTRVLSFKIIFKFPKQSNMGQTCSAPQQTKHKRIPKQVKVITTDYKVSVLDEEEELLHEMWNHVVGKDAVMPTPFFEQGLKMTYCDYVASGRGLQPIETMISDSILPFYANTHTEASITGKTTNTLREEARIAIKRTCGGKVSTKCIFVGSGSTAAVQLIIGMLQLRQSIDNVLSSPSWYSAFSEVEHFDSNGEPARVVVLYGPFEHHSNILPWRELEGVYSCMIPGNQDHSDLDFKQFEKLLEKHHSASLVIVSTSACSNVTGHISDISRINKVISASSAASKTLLFLDYACGAPYLPIDMHTCDAAFISPHKFVGGPGTPGILLVNVEGVIAQRYQTAKPSRVGGGTVEFVTKKEHGYLSDVEQREEGGTPDIIGSIRAGMCFLLKDKIGTDLIHKKESQYFKLAKHMWKDTGIVILGSQSAERVSVLSFFIASPVEGKVLHYNYVVSLLNDLFGIQCRGGCMCAGPLAASLLSIDDELISRYISMSESGDEVFPAVKPGFVRLSLNYFIPEWEARYILSAVALVAKHGCNLMSRYTFAIDGSWTHKKASAPLLSIEDVFTPQDCKKPASINSSKQLLDSYLRRGEKVLIDAGVTNKELTSKWSPAFSNKIKKPFNWFVTPVDL